MISPRVCTLWSLFWVAFLASTAFAGGPKYVAGTSYFNPGTAGTPLTWSQGQVSYYTDQGNLSPILPGPNADALVADAFSQWTSISTASVVASHSGQLAEDVSGSNVYVNPDGSITMPTDIMPSATGTPVGVVYDEDGSVTDALLGQGAGDSSACFWNAAYGAADNFGADTYFLHALVIINGNCAQNTSQLTDVEYRLVRVLGQVLGLGWSQVNDNVFTHKPPATQADYAGLPVMHDQDPPNCIPITLCYPNPYQPKMDDQAALARLYPAKGSSQTARVYGSVFFTDSTGSAAQGMQGVNVVARWIDPNTGLPSRQYAATSVSGFLFTGNAGNPVTGFNDASGDPLSEFGSNDVTLEGFFDLGGLPLPNGAGSGQYQLTVEAIDPLWSERVQPYGPSSQVLPSGSTEPMVVNVTLGEDSEQNVLMLNAVPKPDPFPATSYASPAAVPDGADWEASLSPYGDVDYFWFSGQANRTLSVMVTALDETGAASQSKSEPVIGMWALSDPGTSPAPANTPVFFNSNSFGMTMLNANLLQATDFRIGISDIRGDGRPDYRYHARVLYGDNVQPERASVAGGSPVTIGGLGFQSNTRVTVASATVSPLAISANAILINAPAKADGTQTITLTDPPTGASSVMTGVLTYGAAPTDKLLLIPTTNPVTPVGGQAPNPVRVQAVASDGITPVPGATILFSASPAAGFSACSGAGTCTVISDQIGQASTFVTLLATGATTITAKLAPASYPSPQQVQTTLIGSESALDIALAPQKAWIAQGANASVTLTARVLSNGVPVSGSTVNFQVMQGSGNVNPASATTNANGYASSALQLSSFNSTIELSACVGPNNAPCLSFYGITVPSSGIQLQPVAGMSQAAVSGQALASVTVRAADFSSPPNPVLGTNVLFQSVIERGNESGQNQNPMPIILASSQSTIVTDVNGLASFTPSEGGFAAPLQILGSASAGSNDLPFAIEIFPSTP